MESEKVDTKRLRKGQSLEPGQDFLLRLLNTAMDDEKNEKFFFRGNVIISTLFQLYLMKKYGTKCVPRNIKSMRTGDLGFTLFFEKQPDYSLKEITPESTLGLRETFQQCLAKQPPMIFLYLSLDVKKESSHGHHANMVIYRTASKTFEHFEPHGFAYNYNLTAAKNIDDAILRVLREIHPEPFHYVNSWDVCPKDVSEAGLQGIEQEANLGKKEEIEGGGYCAAWSMFFAEMCLRNPSLSSRQVFQLIIAFLGKTKSKNMHALRHIIHSYTSRMGKVLFRYFGLVLNYAGSLESAATEIAKNTRRKSVVPLMTEQNMMELIALGSKGDKWTTLMAAVKLLIDIESAEAASTPSDDILLMETELAKKMQLLAPMIAEYRILQFRLPDQIAANMPMAPEALAPKEFVAPPYAPPAAIPPDALPKLQQEQVLREQSIVSDRAALQSLAQETPRLEQKVKKYQHPTWWTRMTKKVPQKLASYQSQLDDRKARMAALEKNMRYQQDRLAVLQSEMKQLQVDPRSEYDKEYQTRLAAAKQAYETALAEYNNSKATLDRMKEIRETVAPIYAANYRTVKPVEGGGGKRTRSRHYTRKR